MLPPSCAGCGAPLPPTPTDPSRPDLCPTCATQARSAPPAAAMAAPPSAVASQWSAASPSAATMPVGGPGAPAKAKVRVFDAILVGTATATVAGVAWWAVTTFAELEQWGYLSLLVGVAIGLGVTVGARRSGIGPALIALVLASLTIPVAVYFIDRSGTISAIDDAGRTSDIPLWQGFTFAKDVLRYWIEDERQTALSWLLAPASAFLVALVARRG